MRLIHHLFSIVRQSRIFGRACFIDVAQDEILLSNIWSRGRQSFNVSEMTDILVNSKLFNPLNIVEGEISVVVWAGGELVPQQAARSTTCRRQRCAGHNGASL